MFGIMFYHNTVDPLQSIFVIKVPVCRTNQGHVEQTNKSAKKMRKDRRNLAFFIDWMTMLEMFVAKLSPSKVSAWLSWFKSHLVFTHTPTRPHHNQY